MRACPRGLNLSISPFVCLTLCAAVDNTRSQHSFIRLRVSHCYQARWHRQNLEHFWVYILPYWSRTPVLHCQTNRPYCQLRIGAAHHDLSRSRGDYFIALGPYNMHHSGRQRRLLGRIELLPCRAGRGCPLCWLTDSLGKHTRRQNLKERGRKQSLTVLTVFFPPGEPCLKCNSCCAPSFMLFCALRFKLQPGRASAPSGRHSEREVHSSKRTACRRRFLRRH